jgi:homoserine dehydrogenase
MTGSIRVVRAPAEVPRAVHGIYGLVRRGHRVVAASSAPLRLTCALREAGIGRGVEVVRHARNAQPLLELTPARPLRVALLGHGTVGTGLYRRLVELPDHFAVTGIAVRDLPKAEKAGAPARLLGDCRRALAADCDVVVELIGGTHPASELIEESLRAGRHVATANKAVIAARGPHLELVAREAGVQLLYSASVGGAMPALETVRRHAGEIVSFSGVLNATCNFILDEMALRGLALSDAVALAQREGFAEADPTLDLDGTDAAQKLVILARAAFGRPPPHLFQSGIEHLTAAEGVRLVAWCDGQRGEVRPVALPEGHPLAGTAGPENRLLIQLRDGPPLLLSATGAGRWPTAEAVLADLYDLIRISVGAETQRAPSAA